MIIFLSNSKASASGLIGFSKAYAKTSSKAAKAGIILFWETDMKKLILLL